MIPALKILPCKDRLKACNVSTLHYRRICGDMIETYNHNRKIRYIGFTNSYQSQCSVINRPSSLSSIGGEGISEEEEKWEKIEQKPTSNNSKKKSCNGKIRQRSQCCIQVYRSRAPPTSAAYAASTSIASARRAIKGRRFVRITDFSFGHGTWKSTALLQDRPSSY